jgi:hypothetical protein
VRKEVKRRLPESLNLSLVRSIPIDGEVLTRTDFESYTMLRQLEPEEYNTGQTSGRTIFIGDIHGSFDPLLYAFSHPASLH